MLSSWDQNIDYPRSTRVWGTEGLHSGVQIAGQSASSWMFSACAMLKWALYVLLYKDATTIAVLSVCFMVSAEVA